MTDPRGSVPVTAASAPAQAAADELRRREADPRPWGPIDIPGSVTHPAPVPAARAFIRVTDGGGALMADKVCVCGHTKSGHHSTAKPRPCLAFGCGCREFRRARVWEERPAWGPREAVKPPTVGPKGGAGNSGAAQPPEEDAEVVDWVRRVIRAFPVGGKLTDAGYLPDAEPAQTSAGGWCAPVDVIDSASGPTDPSPRPMWRRIGGAVYVNLPDQEDVEQWVRVSAITSIRGTHGDRVKASVSVPGLPLTWTTLTVDEVAARISEAMESTGELL